MNEGIFLIVLIAVVIVVFAIFVVIQKKKQKQIREKHPGYPKGYWMNQGLGIGVAIGAGMGVALDNIAFWVGVGIALGAAIGLEREKKHKDEVRPLTDEERKLQRQSVVFMSGIFIFGVIIFLISFLIKN